MPDVPPPYDVEAFLTAEVADDQNAARVYREAFAALPDFRDEILEKHTDAVWSADSESTWKEIAVSADVLLRAASDSLHRTLEASRMEQAEFYSLRTLRWTISMPEMSGSRKLARLMRLQARQLYHSGQPSEGAGWLLALMRMARHVAHRGTLVQYLVGSAEDAVASSALVQILDSPHWTRGQLQQIRTRARQLRERTTLLTEPLKVEYLLDQRALVGAHGADFLLGGDDDGSRFRAQRAGMKLLLWIERARSQATLNGFFDEVLSIAARPEYSGRSVAVVPQAETSSTVEATLEQAQQAMPQTIFTTLVTPAVRPFLQSGRRRQFWLRAVELAYSLAAYRKERGAYPETLEALVPEYLPELPADPYAPWQTFRYRRVPTTGISYPITPHPKSSSYGPVIDAEAAANGPHAWMLYSVGENGKDDGGIMNWSNERYADDALVHLPGEPVPPQPRNMRRIHGYDPSF